MHMLRVTGRLSVFSNFRSDVLFISRHAILTLLAATSCTFTGCGLNFAFGVFQDAYETEGGPFLNASPAKIDLIVRTLSFCIPVPH
jgi:hypothetical protein